jgi:hypothetical protein
MPRPLHICLVTKLYAPFLFTNVAQNNVAQQTQKPNDMIMYSNPQYNEN